MSEITEDQARVDATLDAGPARATFSRRTALLGGGAGALALLAAACGGDEGATASTGQATTTTVEGEEPTEEESESESESEAPPAMEEATGDLAVAQVAASLEVLAVGTYAAALEAARSGTLGVVPPAVATFMNTAMEQHQAHLDAWNEVLLTADLTAVTEPPADLQETVDDELADVSDVPGAARLALLLEETAAATYLSAVPELVDPAAIDLAASIHPIDMQHVAVLLFVLGEYPVPETFASTEMAYSA